MTSRKYFIAGNWKMNKTASEGVDLVNDVVAAIGKQTEVTVVVCPPFTALDRVSRAIDGTSVNLGAQDMHAKPSGAYTGEVSAEMLREHFATYVILGHSERRSYFGESDTIVNEKVHTALENMLKPIVCIGETLEERDAGKTLDVIKSQLDGSLANVSEEGIENTVLAYEPVWAIGTGRTASPEQAQEVHAFIRGWLTKRFGEVVAQKLRILYGGSMKPSNAPELLSQPDIDGGLIGGAALDANSFIELVNAASAAN